MFRDADYLASKSVGVLVKFNAPFKYIRQIISNKSDVEDEVLKIDNEFFDELN